VFYGAFVTLCAFSVLWFTERPMPAPVVKRFPKVTVDPIGDSIRTAITRHNWTEYADYGTVQIGRVERPATLLTGRHRISRRIAVPQGGARYEAFVGAVDGAVTVRTERSGVVGTETPVADGTWRRVTLDLDSRDGFQQSIAIDVSVTPGGVAAWGTEVETPLHPAPAQSNVVLISLDTVRRDQLTPYAPALETTPAIGALAHESLVFNAAISTSSWTVASHAALFTGHFPADSLGYTSRIESQEHTLADIFAASGYRTFGVSGGPYTDPRWGLHQGFDEYVVSGDRENARDATSRAMEWLDRESDAPAFVFLNYFNAHEPLVLSPEVKRREGVTDDVPFDTWTNLAAGREPLTPEMRQRILHAYRAELSTIDHELERLFDYLKRTGRWSRTLVIVWADHGQLLGEHGDIGHAFTLDEELIRVPLIIKPPAASDLVPGLYSAPIQNDDLYAVTQALAGLPNSEAGSFVIPHLEDRSSDRLTFSKVHHDPLPNLTSQRRWRSRRCGRCATVAPRSCEISRDMLLPMM